MRNLLAALILILTTGDVMSGGEDPRVLAYILRQEIGPLVAPRRSRPGIANVSIPGLPMPATEPGMPKYIDFDLEDKMTPNYKPPRPLRDPSPIG